MSNQRLIALDILRFLAVVFVLGAHLEAHPPDLHLPLIDAWQTSGTLGVDMFFVLSGFLVSGLLFSEYRRRGELSLSRFYIRRALRIYPPFYALIIVTYLFVHFGLHAAIPSTSLVSEVFFFQSYVPAFWNHTWTLAVEEHFYLAMPLLLLLMIRRNPNATDPFRSLPLVIGGLCLATILIRCVNCLVRSDHSSLYLMAFNTHLRLDALFFGVGIAYFYHYHSEAFRRLLHPWRHALIIAGIVLLVVTQVWVGRYWVMWTFVFTQRYLGSAALMIGLLLCNVPSNRMTRSLAAVGSYSYSIYLWHMAIIRWCLPNADWGIRTAVYLIGAFLVGIAMSDLLEVPMMKARDYLFPAMPPSSNADQKNGAAAGPARQAA